MTLKVCMCSFQGLSACAVRTCLLKACERSRFLSNRRLLSISCLKFLCETVEVIGYLVSLGLQHFYVKQTLKGSLDLIPSPSPSVKIQILWAGKFASGVKTKLCKFRIFLGDYLFKQPTNFALFRQAQLMCFTSLLLAI